MRKFKVGDYVRANTRGIVDYLGITKEEATYLLGGCHEVESVNPDWSASIQSCDNFNIVYNIDDRFLEKVDLPKKGDSITVESLEWFMSTLNGNKDTVFAHNNKCSDSIDIYGFSIIALKTFIARGGKSLLTERYKETIEAAPGELDEMLSEWVSENQVPEHFLEILKDFMNRA